ncbi:MAG: 4Fe-4S binding protein [Planctomycetota bacterium]|jgi:ferredoxin-type protein NapH
MATRDRLVIRRIRFWTWARRLTAVSFLALLFLGRNHWFPWLKGSLTATSWFGAVPVVDPLSGLETALASRSVTTTVLAGAGAVALTAILLGRVFCGWVCPLGLVLDLSDALRGRLVRGLERLGVRIPQFTASQEIKYWLLALCLVLSAWSALPVFTAISPVNLVALAVVTTPGVEMTAVGLLMALELFSRRVFCRALCPLGALHALLGRFGRVRVRVARECSRQLACRQCTHDCPMGIRVLEDWVTPGRSSVADPECTRCGACADGCPGGVLGMGVRMTWPQES